VIALPIKVGFIGCGGVSRGHIRRICDNSAAEIVALCDTSRDAMKDKAKLVGRKLPFYTDYKAMLAKEELDAAIICTPHTLHFQEAMDCLDRGMHVLVEKPMVCTVDRARQLISKSENARRTLMVSYQRHYQPGYRWAHDYIARGKLGNVFFISSYLSQNWAGVTKTWRGRKDLSGGGELMDSGSHIVDIVCWISQLEPVEVTAFVSNEFAQDEEVDILSSVSVRFSNRAIASISINGNAPWFERHIFSGTEGSISYDPETSLRLPNGDSAPVDSLPEAGSPDDNFLAVILGKEEPVSTARDAMKVVQISQAAYLSEQEGRAVKINEL
jgi:predicted dehydrogenase